MEKIAERITLAPQILEGIDLGTHLTLLQKAGETVLTMIKELRRGNHLERIRLLNDQLQAIEGEGDKRLLELLRTLYNSPTEVMKVVFLKDILELLEKVFDRCRDAGNVINHIVLKNS